MRVAMLPLEANEIDNNLGGRAGYSQAMMMTPRVFASVSPDSFNRAFQYVEADVGFPNLVRDAVKMGSKSLNSGLPPFLFATKAGHDDIGLVLFVSGYGKEDLDPNAETHLLGDDRNVVARVSYGLGNLGDKRGGWDSKGLGRLHLGVYGFREFRPRGAVGKLNLAESGCLREEVHFTLRWLMDEEGRWCYHNPYGVRGPGETRTPWMNVSPEPWARTNIPITQRRIRIPYDAKLNEFGQPVDSDRLVQTTNSGYGPVLGLLGEFGKVSSDDDVSVMSPEDGTKYLFNRVVPALKKFLDAE